MAERKGKAHCESCGFTEEDAKLHGHRICKNAGNAPWEKRVRINAEQAMNPSPQPSREETMRRIDTMVLGYVQETGVRIEVDSAAYRALVIMVQAAYSAGEAARKEKDCKAVCGACRAGMPLDMTHGYYGHTVGGDTDECRAAAIRKES